MDMTLIMTSIITIINLILWGVIVWIIALFVRALLKYLNSKDIREEKIDVR